MKTHTVNDNSGVLEPMFWNFPPLNPIMGTLRFLLLIFVYFD